LSFALARIVVLPQLLNETPVTLFGDADALLYAPKVPLPVSHAQLKPAVVSAPDGSVAETLYE
jgi:hypothetical protein